MGQAVQQLYVYVAQRMQQGASDYTIQKELVNQGLSQDNARSIIRKLNEIRRQQIAKHAMQQIAIGVVICIIGIVVSVATYNNAVSAGGGRYVVAWGAVVFGAWRALKGFMLLNE